MKNKNGQTMQEDKGPAGRISTCFEGPAWAKMMRRTRAQDGIGSLCDGVMRSLAETLGRGPAGPSVARKKARRKDKNGPGAPAAPGRTPSPHTGGRK
jgi:hypothetical protein